MPPKSDKEKSERQKMMDYIGELYEKYCKYAYIVAYKILKNREDAQDIAQDTFVRLLENYEKYNLEDETKVKGLIFNISRGLAINLYNSNEYQKTVSIEEVDERLLADTKAANMLQACEEEEVLLSYLSKLPPEYRDVLMMKYLDQYTVKEIAMAKGITYNACELRIRKGEKMLKKLLRKGAGYND